MGSENPVYDESPSHQVSIKRDFLLGKYPVTQQQWTTVIGENPSVFVLSPQHPVDNVSWLDATEFCQRLTTQSQQVVRLPSEAEWEYACRCGSTTDFWIGDGGPYLDYDQIPFSLRRELCEYAWFDLNSQEHTHSVGMKRPNGWGFHDLLGNVWEWCADVWHRDYFKAPLDGSAWLDGADQQSRRCLRGAAWDMNAFRCRSSYRSYDHLDVATSRIGFRIVVEVASETG